MDDSKIIELFYERSEQAIIELSKSMALYVQKLLLTYSIIRKILKNV